jgi:hypothetical protein
MIAGIESTRIAPGSIKAHCIRILFITVTLKRNAYTVPTILPRLQACVKPLDCGVPRAAFAGVSTLSQAICTFRIHLRPILEPFLLHKMKASLV